MESSQEQGNEYIEWVEKTGTEYMIEWETNENGWVNNIVMSEYYKPLGKNYANGVETEWAININGDNLEITYTVVNRDWYGTGRSMYSHIVYESDDDESWWFEDPEELEKTIKESGVKETIKEILTTISEYLKDVFSIEED